MKFKIVFMVLACFLVFGGCSENWNAGRFPDENLDLGSGDLTVDALTATSGTFSSTLTGFIPIEHNTADTTMTTTNVRPGSLISVTSTTIKRSFALPAAAAGLAYDLWVSESDSGRVTTASGDTLLTFGGSKYKTLSTIAGHLKLRALDATYWAVMDSTGEWAGY